MTVWFRTSTGEHEVKVGSEAHARLLDPEREAQQIAGPDGDTLLTTPHSDLYVEDLRELLAARDLDVPADADHATLLAVLERHELERHDTANT